MPVDDLQNMNKTKWIFTFLNFTNMKKNLSRKWVIDLKKT